MMDVTMEQLYSEMRKLSEGQAVQAQMLTQVLQRLDQHTQISAQQGAQIATLVTEVSVLKSEVATRNLEIVSLQNYRASMSDLFVPRKELEAQNHEGRIKTLENAKDENSDKQFNFLQWLTSNGLTTLFFLIMLIITIYSTFHPK
jgi:hypothetical protein